MGEMELSERYDSFQKPAAAAIVGDFQAEPSGRFLLVIPTGGGKTLTAVRAVDGMYAAGHLKEESDRVMWVIHRDELRIQAEEAFQKYATRMGKPTLSTLVDFVMLSAVKAHLESQPGIRFAVIDEAHHGAAQSYQPLFEKTSVGILGLTATPSRNDGKPLQFSRESYSIGFPDLVDLGVLLRPNVIRVEGGRYDLSDIGMGAGEDSLEALNNAERNGRILAALETHQADLNKAIIYVGTKKHARDLYALLKASPLAADYEAIGLILGGERRRFLPSKATEIQEKRPAFIEAMKATDRSILVNVDVLTEGYDDPSVNAVVMARPTNSKLVYMQAMGRAVRLDPENPEKAAYVLEVTDVLPNITYRIDNRWLFSDVSDALQPAVVDQFYPSFEALPNRINDAFEDYNVPASQRVLPPLSPNDRVTMLLFKVYSGADTFRHIPVVITNATRSAATEFFNFLSTRMERFHGMAFEAVFSPVRKSAEQFSTLTTPDVRKNVLGAMENAWELVVKGPGAGPGTMRAKGQPWITFVSFRLQPDVESLSTDLLAFTADMLNSEAIRETLRLQMYADGYVLTRLPLPLRGTLGALLPPGEFEAIRSTVEALKVHAEETNAAAQWTATVDVLGASTLPIAQRHHQSLATIVRESLDYFRVLKR